MCTGLNLGQVAGAGGQGSGRELTSDQDISPALLSANTSYCSYKLSKVALAVHRAPPITSAGVLALYALWELAGELLVGGAGQ